MTTHERQARMDKYNRNAKEKEKNKMYISEYVWTVLVKIIAVSVVGGFLVAAARGAQSMTIQEMIHIGIIIFLFIMFLGFVLFNYLQFGTFFYPRLKKNKWELYIQNSSQIKTTYASPILGGYEINKAEVLVDIYRKFKPIGGGYKYKKIQTN